MARGLVVGADRDPHRAVLAALEAERDGDPGGDAVGGDHDRGGVGLLVPDPAAAVVDRLRGDAGDAAGALVDDRAGDRRALHQPGAGLLGVPGEDLVEVRPGADHAVGRERREVGPGQLEAVAGADDAQAVVLLPARGVEVDAHRDQLADRARGEPVAADLVAGERRLLQQQDVDPGLREVVRRAGPGRAGADDDDVGLPRVGGGPGHARHLSTWRDKGDMCLCEFFTNLRTVESRGPRHIPRPGVGAVFRPSISADRARRPSDARLRARRVGASARLGRSSRRRRTASLPDGRQRACSAAIVEGRLDGEPPVRRPAGASPSWT